MKPQIFVDRRLPSEAWALLEEHCNILTWRPDEDRSVQGLYRYLSEAEGYLTSGSMKVNEQLLTAAPKLKIISSMSVGYNHFDIEAMKKYSVIGTHTPHILDDTVADLVLGLMLSCSRRISELDRYIRNGHWRGNEGRRLFGQDVHHRKLGIIGMGRIGEAVAKRALYGFDMEVSYYARSAKPELEQSMDITYRTLDELLATSDFIVMLTPLTAATTGLIGKEQFSLMQEHAIFINASRGPTVDEQALIEALQQGKIAGAGLDVFIDEPLPLHHPLMKLEQVVMTPHIGSATEETRNQMAMMAVRNLIGGLSGDQGIHIVPELKDSL